MQGTYHTNIPKSLTNILKIITNITDRYNYKTELYGNFIRCYIKNNYFGLQTLNLKIDSTHEFNKFTKELDNILKIFNVYKKSSTTDYTYKGEITIEGNSITLNISNKFITNLPELLIISNNLSLKCNSDISNSNFGVKLDNIDVIVKDLYNGQVPIIQICYQIFNGMLILNTESEHYKKITQNSEFVQYMNNLMHHGYSVINYAENTSPGNISPVDAGHVGANQMAY
jgi:hypothetical protein